MGKLKLPHLTSAQFAEIEQRAKLSGIHPDTCPTCGSVADEWGERESGEFTLDNITQKCDCQGQIMLRKHYLLANIPDQYMRLDWDRDYVGDNNARIAVENFLKNWNQYKLYGMGLELGGPLGVGKTFAATTIARELVKRREDVFFLPFNQMLYAIRHDDKAVLARMNESNVLILDEVQAPPNDSLRNVMENHFESVVRNRTNYNGVTILTTNLSEQDMQAHYRRAYSLLAAKEVRVEISGDDVRKGAVGRANLARLLSGEQVPIS